MDNPLFAVAKKSTAPLVDQTLPTSNLKFTPDEHEHSLSASENLGINIGLETQPSIRSKDNLPPTPPSAITNDQDRLDELSSHKPLSRPLSPVHTPIGTPASASPISIPLSKNLSSASHLALSPSSLEFGPGRPRSNPESRLSRSVPQNTRHFHTRSLSTGSSDDELLDDEVDHAISFSRSPPTLPLTPFANQVGGHTSFLRFSERAVCKPVDPIEKEFYESVEVRHPELKPFIASYLGVVNVSYTNGGGPFSARMSSEPSQTDKSLDWMLEGTPMIVLEQNPHILNANEIFDNPKDEEEQQQQNRIVLEEKKFNKQLQQQVFREALSPKSLRARFAQLKTTFGAIKKNTLDTQFLDINEEGKQLNTPLKSSPMREESHFFEVENISERSFNEKDKSMDSLKSDKDSSSPFFEMSDDEVEHKMERDRRKPQNVKKEDLEFSDKPIISQSSQYGRATSISNPSSTRTAMSLNPWSLQCYTNSFTKMGSSQQDLNKVYQFLLLEDLTAGLKYPCILDLKMGTRQHGVDCSQAKKESQERKCAKSTSQSLGVRICGMQVCKV